MAADRVRTPTSSRSRIRRTTGGRASTIPSIASSPAWTKRGSLASGETVAPAVDAAIDAIDDQSGPAVCRIDHSLDNVLVDSDSGETTAFLDWEFQFAGTPAYDLAFVERSLAGGAWGFTPDAPTRHERVREALLAGYRDAGGDAVADRFRANRDAYALLVDAHELFNFEDALDVFDVPEPQREAAADRLRATVRDRCERVTE
jgi:Phosphotransferase enzyme family.